MNSNEILSLCAAAYRQGNFEEAYDILIKSKDNNTKDASLIYFTISLACKLNKVKDAMLFLNEAVITHGMWYNTEFLDSDPNLEILRELDDYKNIYNICKQRQVDLRFTGEKKIDILVPDITTNKLFLILPGNFQSIDEVKKSVNEDSIKDYIIAIPQAREFHSYQKHLWGDIDFGLKVVLEHYKEIIEEHDINENEVVLSSFAGGGNVIFKALVENTFPASKFVFFAPKISNLESFEPQIKALRKRNIKIFIVCGENDSHYLPGSIQLDELLTKNDVNHKFVVLKDLNHSFPINTKEIIKQVIMYFDKTN